jgi:hypothetical protein
MDLQVDDVILDNFAKFAVFIKTFTSFLFRSFIIVHSMFVFSEIIVIQASEVFSLANRTILSKII